MGLVAAAATDLDRFKGTQWEADFLEIRDEVLKNETLSDRHGYLDNIMRNDLRGMKGAISSSQNTLKKVGGSDVDNKLALRIDIIQKLVPLQQAFEEELHKKASAKKRSYDEADAVDDDFDEDFASASQEEQLAERNRKEQKRWQVDQLCVAHRLWHRL